MFWRLIATAVAMLCSSEICLAQELCAPEKLPLTTFGEHYSLGYTLSKADSTKTFAMKLKGAEQVRYARLLISAPSKGPYDIEIRDYSGKILQSIGSGSVRASQDTTTFWSNRLPAEIVRVDVSGLPDKENVKILEYQAMPTETDNPYYSVKGNAPYWFDVYSDTFSDGVKTEADSVGMLVSSQGSAYNGFKNWCCSGSMISTEPTLLFMTNYHCGGADGSTDYWSDDICHHTIIDFSWDGDSVSREFQCMQVKVRRKDLDLAVLEVAPLVSGSPPPPPVNLRTSLPVAGQGIHIIHHPQCLQKQVSVACTVVKPQTGDWLGAGLMTDFEHDCNTEGGSSGAPVFDNDGDVIGLHHLPHHQTNSAICEPYNAAVSMSSIINALRDISPTPVLKLQ